MRPRRILLLLVLGGLLWVGGWWVFRPQPARALVIGVVNLSPMLEPVLEGFRAELDELGYIEGEQVTYIYAGPAATIDALDAAAQELVALKVDLILALSTPAAQAAYRATTGTVVPVVFAPVTDPVAAGIVITLSRPGGNVTGVMLGTQSESKRLEWLVRLAPNLTRIYLPYNSDDASARASTTAVRAAAAELGLDVIVREARTTDEITAAIAEIPAEAQAIFLPQDSLVAARIDDFAAAATARKLPLCTPTDGQVARGALISYSFALDPLGRQAAHLAEQILKGASPATLPVETAEFFLSINLKTADTIGLFIPDDIVRVADTVIR